MVLRLDRKLSKPATDASNRGIEVFSFLLNANDSESVETFLRACTENDMENLRFYLQREGIRRREIRDAEAKAKLEQDYKLKSEENAKYEAKLAAQRLEKNRIYYQIGSIRGTLRKDWLSTAGNILGALIILAAILLLSKYMPAVNPQPTDDIMGF